MKIKKNEFKKLNSSKNAWIKFHLLLMVYDGFEMNGNISLSLCEKMIEF